jgi:hypothetical protein
MRISLEPNVFIFRNRDGAPQRESEPVGVLVGKGKPSRPAIEVGSRWQLAISLRNQGNVNPPDLGIPGVSGERSA